MTKKEAIEMLKTICGDCRLFPKCAYKKSECFTAIDMAIKALGGKDVAQEIKYTFGNDEFNLEAAYHDCKLVFDGITDDDSFQKADTGVILYYANEIIYALHEALEGEDTDVPSSDAISRKAAIDLVRDVCDAIMSGCESWYDPETEDEVYKDIREVDAILKCNKEIRIALRNMPSAQPEKRTEERTETHSCDLISRQWLMECVNEGWIKFETEKDKNKFIHLVRDTAPSAQPSDEYDRGWEEGREALREETWEYDRDRLD